ncbi:MAG: ExeM/NucH family extracellular endonuclease [Anaerolineae bacterium]|jgi:predicted extracellular nuclease|nr:ExeM/NucH family extracellular endonuclease [Chloroflexota bacterium]
MSTTTSCPMRLFLAISLLLASLAASPGQARPSLPVALALRMASQARLQLGNLLSTDQCGQPSTAIGVIQGSGSSSPLAGSVVTVEGIVTADLQNNAEPDDGDWEGYFLGDPPGDGDPATSDGIFVYAPGADHPDVSVGDRLRVTGTVIEYYGRTEIRADGAVVCATGQSVPPTILSLPWQSAAAREALEGMLLSLPQALVVLDTRDLGRYGQVTLGSQRQLQATQLYSPTAPEVAPLLAQQELDRLVLDDGLATQNPVPVRHPAGGLFSLEHLIRAGDTLSGVTGVLDYAYGQWVLQPTTGARHQATNPRPSPPAGNGPRIASLNLHNYFVTLDRGQPVCGPAADQLCRGANTALELERQRAKLVSTLLALDAHLVAVLELENHPGEAPVEDLVQALNQRAGEGSWAALATGPLGIDVIRVGILFRPALVEPLGEPLVLDSLALTNPLGYLTPAGTPDELNRPALAQRFRLDGDGRTLTVVVAHLKSRGSACDPLGGDDGLQDDDPLQGNCNLTRTEGARALAAWLAETEGIAPSETLLLGDLNAYAGEDPLLALQAEGWDNLISQHAGADAYSYLYDGVAGYLDHALVQGEGDLLSQAAGAGHWHSNADEPALLDYDMTYKPAGQDALYAPDAFRSSDHDPVLVTLRRQPLEHRIYLPLVLHDEP